LLAVSYRSYFFAATLDLLGPQHGYGIARHIEQISSAICSR
jgi:hypothetical protein